LKQPTPAEMAILNLLWKMGPLTVRQVHEAQNRHLEPNRQTGYTTTLKIMQIMHEKGLLKRDTSGRSHIYQSNWDVAEARSSMLNDLIDTAFQGSSFGLIMQALGDHQTSSEELEKIKSFLADMESKNGGVS